jgi:hypothetical protein
MRHMQQSLLLLGLLALICAADVPTGSTVCILPTGKRSTNVTDCSSGEVFLIGQFVNLGVHNVASFGTQSAFEASYFAGQLGFIADYDKNGFASSTPGFAGDYFVPGSPLEGNYAHMTGLVVTCSQSVRLVL